MTALLRFLTPSGWLIVGGVLAALIAALFLWTWLAGRADGRADEQAAARAAETRAAAARETAATERALDGAANAERLKGWNDDADRTPDAVPDERELRRRCRQLRDAGYADLAACRGFAD